MTAEDYFEAEIHLVLGSYLSGLGLTVVSSQPRLVRFANRDCFVEALVFAEEGPKYCPRIEIGPLPELGGMSRDKQIDIMHTVPKSSPFRRYNLEWRYSNKEEMESVFSRVRDQIFDDYARPYLFDRVRLLEVVRVRSEEIDVQWQGEIRDHNDTICRRNAMKAFSEKNYREFIQEMAKIPLERLSPSEVKKLNYALRHA